jgi:hypothetical protein
MRMSDILAEARAEKLEKLGRAARLAVQAGGLDAVATAALRSYGAALRLTPADVEAALASPPSEAVDRSGALSVFLELTLDLARDQVVTPEEREFMLRAAEAAGHPRALAERSIAESLQVAEDAASRRAPPPAVVSLDPEDTFRMLSALALIDGTLDKAEKRYLLDAAARLRLTTQRAGEILNDVRREGRIKLPPPPEAIFRPQLFQEMVRLVMADGRASQREQQLVLAVGKHLDCEDYARTLLRVAIRTGEAL